MPASLPVGRDKQQQPSEGDVVHILKELGVEWEQKGAADESDNHDEQRIPRELKREETLGPQPGLEVAERKVETRGELGDPIVEGFGFITRNLNFILKPLREKTCVFRGLLRFV